MDKEYDFKFSCLLDDNDYYEFNKIHILTSSVGKKALLNYKLSVPLLSLILIVFIAILRFDITLIVIELIIMAVMDIIWVLVSDKSYFRKLKKSFAKLKKDGSLSYDKSGELVFYKDEFIDTSENTVITRDYSSVEKIVITEKAVYLYTSASTANIIKSECFKSESEKSDFLNYIISKAPKTNIINK